MSPDRVERPIEPEGVHERQFFRREAYEHLAATPFGEPIAHLPISWGLLTIAFLGMVVATSVFLSQSVFERRETVNGVLEATAGNVEIFPSDRGVVRSLMVEEGRLVKSGDVVAIVATEHSSPNGSASVEQTLETLAQQKINLTDRLLAVSQSDHMQEQAATSQLRALNAKLKTARADLAAARDQNVMAIADYEIVIPVAKNGFISQIELHRRKQAVISSQRDVSDSLGQIAELEAEIAEEQSIAAERPSSTIKSEGEIHDLLTNVDERRAQYEQNRGYVVRAPVSGRITALQTNIGGIADPARPLMAIIPKTAHLMAVLYVPSRSSGFLSSGEAVHLHYDAFPFQRFGTAEGSIASVSETALRPQDVEGIARVDEPCYRVIVHLSRQYVTAFGLKRALRAGMTLTADVSVGQRSLLTWMFEPLLAASRNQK